MNSVIDIDVSSLRYRTQNVGYRIINYDVEFIEDSDNKDISNNNYVFKNQRIHTLARKYLDKEFGGVPTSTFNTTGEYTVHDIIVDIGNDIEDAPNRPSLYTRY